MEELPVRPKVSAVIISCDCAGALRRCLAALERSVGRETMEILVVDNGSRDESPRLDAEFPNIHMLRLPRNFGFTKALNIGMRTGTGEFFFFVPPEVEVLPETVSVLVEKLESTPDAVAVCPAAADEGGGIVTRYRPQPIPEEVYEAWREGDFSDWSTPGESEEPFAAGYVQRTAMLARAGFLRGMRYIDERYGQYGWDLELCTQIRRASRKVLLFPCLRVAWRPASEPVWSASPQARALLSADRALGAAVFARKHYGQWEGAKLRMAVGFRAFIEMLGALVRFRDVRYRFARFNFLLGGQKVDGSQRVF